MKKTFKLVGLDCAHCADMIEKAVSRIEGVKEANVNFMTTKMTLECEDDKVCTIVQDVKKIIKKMEPGVEVKKI